jgi:glycosyltransferase involved in cell wall biosynthesis
MSTLVAVILTHNESAHILDCIESVRFADAIVVFDSFSTDDTVAKAKSAGAEVIQHPFDNYADQRNAALDAVADRADWVLFVDADERVTDELAQEVREAIASSACVGWRIPRHNYIFGKLTRATGWYPDYQTRLLKVGATRYDPTRKVHEVVILDGPEGTLKEHLIHYNYRDAAHFARKQKEYTAYEAGIMHAQGIHPKPHNYLLQPLRHFWWRFVRLQGYRDGLHGLRLSLLMSWYEFRKYVMLGQLWKKG